MADLTWTGAALDQNISNPANYREGRAPDPDDDTMIWNAGGGFVCFLGRQITLNLGPPDPVEADDPITVGPK